METTIAMPPPRGVGASDQELVAVSEHDIGDVGRREDVRWRRCQGLSGDAGLLQEVLEAARREHPEHPHSVGADGEGVRDVARPEGVLAAREFDRIVSDVDRDRAVKDNVPLKDRRS